jgi:5-formyltetrahydrofolate cyclo-ligase
MPDFASDAERSRSAKLALRDRLLAARRSMTASDRRSASASLQVALLALVRAEQPSTIAAYVPVGSEPGGADLPSVLASAGRLLLPVLLDDHDLDWAAYRGSLSAGPRGLLQPTGERLGVDAVREASLVVVPAVAVDRSGVRLGRGGGSYDRVLARLDRLQTAGGVMTVALLYDGELVEAVPAEPHDRTVRAAITPSGGLTLSRSSEWTK